MAKRICTPCLTQEVRSALTRAVVPEHAPSLQSVLDQIPDCATVSPAKEGGKKEKRAPSPYNIFIGTCMKAGKITKFKEAPERMKHCAAQWRAQKGK